MSCLKPFNSTCSPTSSNWVLFIQESGSINQVTLGVDMWAAIIMNPLKSTLIDFRGHLKICGVKSLNCFSSFYPTLTERAGIKRGLKRCRIKFSLMQGWCDLKRLIPRDSVIYSEKLGTWCVICDKICFLWDCPTTNCLNLDQEVGSLSLIRKETY